jgi:hypothetical protein
VFSDEAACQLLSGLVSTYAPPGQTPVLSVPLSYDRLSVMAAISNTGDWLTWRQDHPVTGPDWVRFLKHILAHLPGKIRLVWDGLPAQPSQPIQAFLARGAAQRLTLLQRPAYAPDLNPQQGMWRSLKYLELGNLCAHDLAELRLELRRAIQPVRYRLDLIVACLLHANCSVSESITE